MTADLPDLSGYAVLVTGASGGIGAGIARRFAAAGAVLVLGHRADCGPGARRAADLAVELTAAGRRAVPAAADTTDAEACAELVAVAEQRFGRLDAVVGCAGVQPVVELSAMTGADWRQVLDVDLTGAFHTVQAAAAAMRDTGGSITLVASVEGSRPAPGHAHYASAKAGVVMLARAAALEYGAAGIRVNSVSPGLTDRPGLADQWPDGLRRWQQAAPLGRVGAAAEIGDACVFLASPMAAFITGHDLVVDGGMSAVAGW